MNRLDVLFQHCADLGLNVEWHDLGEYRRGAYYDARKLILVNVRLTRAQATATLAHEVGHAIHGDHCSTVRTERRAWETGASLVIRPGEYAAAERLVGCHPAALALELEVTPKLIEAWRRWYHVRRPRELVAMKRAPSPMPK